MMTMLVCIQDLPYQHQPNEILKMTQTYLGRISNTVLHSSRLIHNDFINLHHQHYLPIDKEKGKRYLSLMTPTTIASKHVVALGDGLVLFIADAGAVEGHFAVEVYVFDVVHE